MTASSKQASYPQAHLAVAPAHATFAGKGATLIKNAILVTGTSDGEYRGDLLVEDGAIKALGRDLGAPGHAQLVDGSDFIVAPGFIDTHRHMWQTAYKGMAYDLSLMEYFQRLYGAYAGSFRAQDIYASTYLGRLAALDAGITTVLDWSHNINSAEMEEAAVQALWDADGRAVFGHGYTSDRMFDLERYRDQPRRREDVKRTRDLLPSDDALVSSCFLGHEPGYFISLEACGQEYAVARELGMRISTHIVSLGQDGQPYESIEALHAAGLMGEDVTYIHLNNASDHELRLIAETGGSASVAAQIESHMIGFRTPPVGRLLLAGVRPSLSNDTVIAASDDLFSHMRAAFDGERSLVMSGFEKRPDGFQVTTRDVLDFATLQGARAIGMGHRLGTLEAGKRADLILVRTDAVNMMPVNDPVAALVFCANVGDVDTVLVDGKAVKRGGQLLADTKRARALIEASVEYLYWQDRPVDTPDPVRPHPAAMPLCLCHAAGGGGAKGTMTCS